MYIEIGESYRNPEHMLEVVAASQAAYAELFDRLLQDGTEVRRSREVQEDPHYPSALFFSARHDIVFPSQPVTKTTTIFIPSAETNFRRAKTSIERHEWAYDQAAVRSRLILDYNNTSQRARILLMDSDGQRNLPKPLAATLSRIYLAFSPI